MATNENTTQNDDSGSSLRDAIDAAFTQHATDEPDQQHEEGQQQEAAPAAPAPEDGRQRDDLGRFKPKAPAAEAPAAPANEANAQANAQAKPPAAPAPQELKAPGAWRPHVREKWAGLDAEVKEEIHRREVEGQRVLQDAAQARQFLNAFERVVAPYEVFIRQENSNPLQAVQNLMQTAADLRVGTPQHKAQLVAGMIQNFGVDVGMLDTLLAGQQLQPGQQAQQVYRDPRVDQIMAAMQQQQQQAQQNMATDVQRELSAFEKGHEFYADVAGVMGDLVEIKTRRGETVDLEAIYKQACAMDESVSKILAARAAASNGNQQRNAVLRAKRAAVSVQGDTNAQDGSLVPKDDSIRAAIEAAFDSHAQG